MSWREEHDLSTYEWHEKRGSCEICGTGITRLPGREARICAGCFGNQMSEPEYLLYLKEQELGCPIVDQKEVA